MYAYKLCTKQRQSRLNKRKLSVENDVGEQNKLFVLPSRDSSIRNMSIIFSDSDNRDGNNDADNDNDKIINIA